MGKFAGWADITMLFSVLVPVYNVEKYLDECIQSILNQSVYDYEVILVDDGSTDNSGIICDQYAKKCPNKIKVIHKQNEGLISARRIGILHAKGDFCLFVDSDDYVEKNWLEVIAKYINGTPNLDMLIFSYQYVNNGKVIQRINTLCAPPKKITAKSKKELYQKLIFTNTITSLCTKAIRTTILKSDPTCYLQYKNKNMAEDLMQTLWPITQAQKIIYADQALYNYRYSPSSISRNFTATTVNSKNTLHVYEKILEFLPLWGIDDTATKEKLRARWFNETMYTMSMYYEQAHDVESKRAILTYDWPSMMPDGAWDSDKKHINQFYKKVFCSMAKRQFFYIKLLFFQKKISCYVKQIIRNVKHAK